MMRLILKSATVTIEKTVAKFRELVLDGTVAHASRGHD
jgi:hypothetical protein